MSERCKSSPMGGGRCELEAGHEGRHRKTSYPSGFDEAPFVFDWDDVSQRRLADRYASRLD